MKQSPLTGKNILFLGSSVTYGSASGGISFAEYLAARHHCTAVKEAVSGTTLAGSRSDTYLSRLKALKLEHADLMICQLSTNDASQNLPLGTVSSTADIFDINTVAGAIEAIIHFTKSKWNCPIYFYTSPRYESKAYAAMTELLLSVRDKWNIGIIDLWNNDTFNAISDEQRAVYMADPIHPTQKGYLEWWTPEFEKILLNERI